MALTRELCGLSVQLLRNKVFLYTAVRCFSDKPVPWSYRWKPGKYSEKDHDKIAEKYNLHPKEYQPYDPSEQRYLGDYPKLPMIGPAAKDPYYPYDIPIYKRNYKEPVHDMINLMGEDRYSYGVKERIDPLLGIAICLLVFGTFAAITYLVRDYPIVQPRLERQYPKAGVVHYSFEPADS